MNETPFFMRHCLSGCRHDKNIGWALKMTAEEVFGTPVTSEEYEKILNRPKTPSRFCQRRVKCEAWLSRYFRPVYMAYLRGDSDEELLKRWRCTERFDMGGLKEFKRNKAMEKERRQNMVIRWRDIDKSSDWGTVK